MLLDKRTLEIYLIYNWSNTRNGKFFGEYLGYEDGIEN